MIIVGVDYHPSFQTIAFWMEETGEYVEQELNHSDGEAERFYRKLKEKGVSVRVGMEATGHARWFERLLAELGFELWIGDPAEIKAKRVRKKAPASAGADADADHESAAGRGNERRLSLEEKTVQRKGRALLETLSLALWASRRRKELLELLDQLDPERWTVSPLIGR